VWVGTVQRALAVNSLQLMLKQMPLSSVILLPFVIFAEDVVQGPRPLVSVDFTAPLVGMIVLTACMAFFVNVSTFYIIAELSPITCRLPIHFNRIFVLFSVSEHLNLLQLQRARPLQDVRDHRWWCLMFQRGARHVLPPRKPKPHRSSFAFTLQAFDLRKACGVCCCIGGAFWYSRLKLNAAPAAATLQETEVTVDKASTGVKGL
jgi:hypothetical protein